MSQPNSTRTPFDDDLVFDPNAPRHTQPLPPQNTNAQNAGAQNVAPTHNPNIYAPGAYVHNPPQSAPVPPQVTPNRAAPDDDFIPTRKLPPATKAGFLVAGGALAVLVLSVVVGKLLPRTPDKTPSRFPTTPSSGTIVMTPPDENRGQSAAPNSRDAENRDSTSNSDSSITVLPSEDSSASTRDVSSSDDARASNDSPGDSSTNNVSRPVRSRRGYALDVPEGFRLKSSGRRTVWTHRDGTNLLVETASADGTPREGWEKLDRALSRKYGAKYRNMGIRETTVDGRNAAVWEFELDLPSGTVRKIDMAVHDGKRGFAVLGSAPAGNFENARGRIESAINSFRVIGTNARDSDEIRESSTRQSSREYSRRDSSRESSSRETLGGDVVGQISRAAGDAALGAAGSVAEAARRQVAESGVGERVKSTVKNTVNGAVNRAVDGAVDGALGTSRREERASTRERRIESPQPRSDEDAPVRNQGY